MTPFQHRVIDEKDELDTKISRLLSFVGGYGFESVSTPEKHRLVAQVFAMQKYSTILGERISNFGRS